MSVDRRASSLLLVAALALLSFAGLGHAPLTLPDEGRYTLLPLEMVQTGDFVTPRLDGVLYFEKPPLHYWMNAASIALFGPTPAAARVVCALFGFATVLLTGWFAGRLAGARAGLCAAAVLATSPLQFALARTNTLDMTVTFFVTATCISLWMAQREECHRSWWYLAAASAALAVLSKGLIGLVIPGALFFLYLLLSGRWELLRRVPWLGSVTLLLAIAAPWHVAMARRHPDFLDYYFVREHFLRFATPIADRAEPFWYFFAVVAVGMAPWTPLLVTSVLRLGALRDRERRSEQPERLYLALWAAFVVLFFSLSRSKLAGYVLPALPPLATLIALQLSRSDSTEGRARVRHGIAIGAALLIVLSATLLAAGSGVVASARIELPFDPIVCAFAGAALATAIATLVAALRRESSRAAGAPARLAGAGALLLFGFAAVAPAILASRTSTALAPIVRRELGPGDLLLSYKECLYDLAAELERPIGAVDYVGELEFGIRHLAPVERERRFPPLAAFRTVWESPQPVWLVVRRRLLARLLETGIRLGDPVSSADGEYLLFRNRAQTAAGAPS